MTSFFIITTEALVVTSKCPGLPSAVTQSGSHLRILGIALFSDFAQIRESHIFSRKKQKQSKTKQTNKQTNKQNMLRVEANPGALRYASNLVVNIEMSSASWGLHP